MERCVRAMDLPSENRISFGDEHIDAILNGGLRTRGITEITGTAGSGKTQICLQLCAQVQLPEKEGGLDAHAAYISTEHGFASKRFEEICRTAVQKKRTPLTVKSMTDRVHVVRVQEADELWETVNQACVLVQRLNVKLVVIDSLTAIFRGEFRGSSIVDMKDRAEMLLQLAATMKRCSHEHGCAFVVVNQVTAAMSNENMFLIPSRFMSYIEQFSVKASLGMTWSNCVNDRIMIHRCRHHVAEKLNAEKENAARRNRSKERGRLRMFHTVLSSHTSSSSVCFFRVQKEGIVGMPEDRVCLSYGGSRVIQSEEKCELLSEIVVTEEKVVATEEERRVPVKKRIKITSTPQTTTTERAMVPC